MDDIIDATNEIIVSVVVATYNHEKYIKKAIESILAQEVDFNYEVLIGEDCSTDNTRAILQQMQPSLPANFKIYFRKENMGQRGGNNFRDLYSKATGKYVIVLEGDDFWTYKYKLQKQVDFLEEHPQYIAVAHNTKVVDDSGEILDEHYPECKNANYTFEDYRNEIMAGQTTTILRRNPLTCSTYKDIQISVYYPGDQRTNYILLCNGAVGCIQEQWSAYRHVISGGNSYSATHKDDAEYSRRRLIFFKEMVAFTRKNFSDNEQALRCIESMHMYYLLKDIIEKADDKSTLTRWVSELSKVNNKMDVTHYIWKRIIKKLKHEKR